MINRGTGESERERAGNKCLAARKNVIAFLPYAMIAEKDFAHWYAERIWKLMSPSNEFFEIFEFYYSQWIRVEKILQFQIQKS